MRQQIASGGEAKNEQCREYIYYYYAQFHSDPCTYDSNRSDPVPMTQTDVFTKLFRLIFY